MNLKGGASKTTTTVYAAVEAMRRGLRVLIIDTDHPKNSSAIWASARGGEALTVVVAHAHRLKQRLSRLVPMASVVYELGVDTLLPGMEDIRDRIVGNPVRVHLSLLVMVRLDVYTHRVSVGFGA
jgi:cellulose biosynthesis protein BcsQ